MRLEQPIDQPDEVVTVTTDKPKKAEKMEADGIDLPESILAELLAAAPDALAMTARLARDHAPYQEVSSTFSLMAEAGDEPA